MPISYRNLAHQTLLVLTLAALGGCTTNTSASSPPSPSPTPSEPPPVYTPATVSFFVGSDNGYRDGPGATAQFGFELKLPEGGFECGGALAMDANANLFVADTYNHRIRKVAPDGVVTTVAGGDATGSIDGSTSLASFWTPSGIAVDGSGSSYVADFPSNRIRKITSDGAVSTLAGSGATGSIDAKGAAASFYGPMGVAVDAGGTVYVVDNGNCLIRTIAPDGTVGTLAGGTVGNHADGTGSAAHFNYPVGIAIDKDRNLYVTEDGYVRKVTHEGVVTTLAGTGEMGSADGPGASARFGFPLTDVTLDLAGNVLVVDSSNNRIRRITPAGTVTTLAGSTEGYREGAGSAALFTFPYGLAVGSDGAAYVSDSGNHRIRKITF